MTDTVNRDGWTGVVDPDKAYLVVENGRITDVVYASSANGPTSVEHEEPVLVIPRRPVRGEWVPDFPTPAGEPVGYTGPSGPSGPSGPEAKDTSKQAGPRYKALRGWHD